MENQSAATAVRGSQTENRLRSEVVKQTLLTPQLKTTITPGNRLQGSFAATLRFDSRLRDPHTSFQPFPLSWGWEERPESSAPVARSKRQAGAGRGGTRPRDGRARPGDWSWRRRHSPGRGPPYSTEDGAPQARTEQRLGGLEGKRKQGK